jgi:hypothetical protein
LIQKASAVMQQLNKLYAAGDFDGATKVATAFTALQPEQVTP